MAVYWQTPWDLAKVYRPSLSCGRFSRMDLGKDSRWSRRQLSSARPLSYGIGIMSSRNGLAAIESSPSSWMRVRRSIEDTTLSSSFWLHVLYSHPSFPSLCHATPISPALAQTHMVPYPHHAGHTNTQAEEQKDKVHQFVSSPVFPVLIVGYEMIRKHMDALKKLNGPLVVCDEGHRLKNSSGNKTIKALNSFRTSRRLILTGTPVQNNLMVTT